MARKAPPQPVPPVAKRRRFDEEFRREAVQMMLDGHTAASVAERLGISCPTLLYRWKQQQLHGSGPVAASLDDRVKELEAELHRVERERDILKIKSVGHFRPQRVTDVYAAVEAIARDGSLATATVCDVLEASRSAYYAWLHGEPTLRDQEIESLTETVRAIFWQHRRRYGTRRIASELADRGIVCSAKRVAKVLRTQGLRAIQPKSFVPKTTESRHGLGYSPNLLLDAADPTRVDELWVGDITYLPLRHGGFCYLAALMDRFTRDIVGWSVAPTMAEPLVLAALRQAIRTRQPKPGLLHHTDRGGQYAGHAYRAVLRRAGVRQSMSRADNCYDNAFMESCFGTFTTEMEMAEYDSEDQA